MTESSSPIDTGVNDTLEFLQRSIPRLDGNRILEVGCGDGRVAAGLVARGANVVAIDTATEAIEEARTRVPDARCVDLLDLADEQYDTIVFTRSLHHIPHYEESLSHAQALLNSGGTLLLEEFDVAAIDVATARWYYDTRHMLSRAGLFVVDAAAITDPLQEWRDDHEHDPPLNTGAAMIAAVRCVFQSVSVGRGPYLYRSLASRLRPIEHANALAASIRGIELSHIADGTFVANGIRVVAKRLAD